MDGATIGVAAIARPGFRKYRDDATCLDPVPFFLTTIDSIQDGSRLMPWFRYDELLQHSKPKSWPSPMDRQPEDSAASPVGKATMAAVTRESSRETTGPVGSTVPKLLEIVAGMGVGTRCSLTPFVPVVEPYRGPRRPEIRPGVPQSVA